MSNPLRQHFLLDPTVTFLNHGSFGATPKPVFDAYQMWQMELERQPVEFLGRRIGDELEKARDALGSFLNVPGKDLVYVPNATFGVNIVARSLDLGPGDHVLATNHEYGACVHAFQFLSGRQGFEYTDQSLPLPIDDPMALADHIWSGVQPNTRLIFMSHITSATALTLPVEEICRRAREAGILTLVDGAHVIGQLPLDLSTLGADFYTSNAHKWLCAPKGTAFLHARPDKQHLLHPLVVGWGWGPTRNRTFGSDFLDFQQFLGTDDLSSYLAVPAAIKFHQEHDWPAVRQQCHALVLQWRERMEALTGLAPLYPADKGFFAQMSIMGLPAGTDTLDLKLRLYDDFRVEIPTIMWNERPFIRISVQGYNDQADVDRLMEALTALLG